MYQAILPCLFLSAAAAAAAEVTAISPQLQDTRWQLQQLDGQPLADQQRPPYLLLSSKDSRMQGFAGCNRMTGSYASDGENLHFKGIVWTRMACVRGMDIEMAVMKALQQTKRYHIDAGRLRLLDGDGKALLQLEAAALQ